MKITCKGSRIKTVVNGITVCDKDFDGILDDEVHKKHDVGLQGHIALQMHRKAELNIQFKDLYIKNWL